MLYFARRIGSSLLTLALLATLTFFLIRLAPGGPFDGERAWPPEIKANIDHRYGLDLPVTRQYLLWARDLFHGDLRESFQYLGRPVSEMIGEALPISVELGVTALLLSLLVGIPLGCLSAWSHRTKRVCHWVATTLSVAGMSLPSYLVASLLILLFSLKLGWFPPALWEDWRSMVLPVLSLALRPLAVVARLTRAAMLDTLGSDYIRTARAKGVSTAGILFKHALMNSLIPVLTTLGPLTASLLTGSFVIESVFQIPGVGRFFVEGVLNRDYPLVMGITLVFGVILVGSNLVVDLLYGWVDPRIRVV